MAKKEISVVRVYDAPIENVWRAWIEADQLKQWWSPRGFSTPVAEIDVRVGGKLHIIMQAGENMGAMSGMKAPMKGVFTEVVEQQKLVFENSAVDENDNVLLSGMTQVTFESEGGKTKVTVRASAEGTAPGTDMMLAGMEQGWNEQSDKLGEFLAR